VFVCGDLKLDYRREPNAELWALFEETATRFFGDVKAGKIADAFGQAIEVPLIRRLYPPVPKKVLDYREHPDAFKVMERARMLGYHTEQKTQHENGAEEIKAMIRGIMLD